MVVEGELDLATAPTLELELDRLEWWRPRLLLVDLRGLTFMDLAGMRVLIAAHKRAERRGGELAIVRGPPIVERLMQLLGLDSVLDLIDDPFEVPSVRLLKTSCRSGGWRASPRVVTPCGCGRQDSRRFMSSAGDEP